MDKENPLCRKYTFLVFIIPLLVAAAFVFLCFSQEQKSDPSSEKIIRDRVASDLKKEPNELTDEDFANITSFGLSDVSVITSIDHANLPAIDLAILKSFGISGCITNTGIADIKLLEKFTNLKMLALEDISYPANFISKWISLLPKLGIFNLHEIFSLNLNPIGKLNCLERLYISNTHVKNIKPLAGLTNLQILSLSNTPVANFEPLKNLVNLKELDIGGTSASHLESIKTLVHLKELHLGGREIINLEPISGLKNLEILSLYNCPNINDEQIKVLQRALPSLKISNRKIEFGKRTNRLQK